jgi:alginate O-acetyltransferase complex protein AlgI
MAFNSWEFAIFFILVYALYAASHKLRIQNGILLLASYYFYAAWNWKFLSLIIISTIVDYICGQKIFDSQKFSTKKMFLVISIFANLGILGFFKYYNFFLHNLENLLTASGFSHSTDFRLNIILPVGISFYTFQTMSYTIDIFRGKLRPSKSLLNFALFVAFFPQLVAGPIEKARNLLPQIAKTRTLTLEDIRLGVWLIFWGLWKKIVIADNLARVANSVFNNPESQTALAVYIGVLAFAFQIYCDFSGYSDIARGIARLMGIKLSLNFDLPYTAINPSEFWRKWHISLSSWLRENLYFPLGGNRCSKIKTYRNLMLTMLLGGLWHGASWNYIWWGIFHGLLLVFYQHYKSFGWKSDNKSPLVFASKIVLMFHITLVGWLIFRCTGYFDQCGIMSSSFEHMIVITSAIKNGMFAIHDFVTLKSVIITLSPLILIQAAQYYSNNMVFHMRLNRFNQALFYSFLLLTWLLKGAQTGNEFIYFQF